MLISGAFKVKRLSITHVGGGVLYVPQAQTSWRLSINNSGTGIVAYDGPVLKLSLDTARSSTTYVTAVAGDVIYSGSGLSKTYIQPAKNSIAITGKANSLASVTVGGKQCSKVCQVSGTSRFRNPCNSAFFLVLISQL
eukprot:TRINITY_DN8514_c0_g1_i3.p3 TRINITY_DN8514_c0_g1~~TRINITY_DN8514_c0_g1_i3.p3  ORF type:complete len:150 (-),score=6.70 TRINITY_DN8514_c0_g1_i3:29-442(-)